MIVNDSTGDIASIYAAPPDHRFTCRTLGTMNGSRSGVAHIRRLQSLDQAWRDEHPELALRAAALDLLTGCGAQRYADHPVSNDVARLDAAVGLLDREDQRRLDSEVEERSLRCVRELDVRVGHLRDPGGDLDLSERLRTVLVTVPTQILLGRDDEEAASDLVCWNETHGVLDGVSIPYRCASRIASLAYWGAADRYRVIEPMAALRDRYESGSSHRGDLDVAVRAAAREFVAWFGTAGAPRSGSDRADGP